MYYFPFRVRIIVNPITIQLFYSIRMLNLLKSKTLKLEQNMMRCSTLPLEMWFNGMPHFDELSLIELTFPTS
jgi:hypothetical protein